MKTVSNTTPIISLSSIGKIEILRDLFKTIIIPQAVYDEIKAKRGYGYNSVDSSFIKIQSIQDRKNKLLLSNKLDLGEAETIVLAKEIQADNVIIDENIGYRVAIDYDLNVFRTLSILLKAKEEKIITEVKPLIEDMISNGRWYSKNVYYSFLEKANEI
jgi:predicted nucleic acid-binding protein